MATKLNVGIDEELVRQMISGQTPPSTNVIRKSVSKEAAILLHPLSQHLKILQSPTLRLPERSYPKGRM